MKTVSVAVVATAPLMIDLWGIQVPALSMLLGLFSVVLVRIMLMSKDFTNDRSFWTYNVALTILMVFITFAIIADRQFTPGVSVMVGTGIGASGMVLVDILKDRIQAIVQAAIGKAEE
jgi:hypothetical protein